MTFTKYTPILYSPYKSHFMFPNGVKILNNLVPPFQNLVEGTGLNQLRYFDIGDDVYLFARKIYEINIKIRPP